MSSYTPAFPGAASAIDYGTEDSAWGSLSVEGIPLPGFVTVAGVLARKIDTKRPPGSSYVSLTYLGYEPARIEVQVRLWTEAHLESWEFFAALLQPRPNKGLPKAVDVAHPALALHGIRRVFVDRIGLLQPGQVKGTWETRISLIEARPITTERATSTPTATTGASSDRETAFTPTVLTPAGEREAARPSSGSVTP